MTSHGTVLRAILPHNLVPIEGPFHGPYLETTVQGGISSIESGLPVQPMPLVRFPQSEGPQEGLPELGRGQIVQDGVNGRIDVAHDPAEVEQIVELFHGQGPDVWHHNDPED